MGTTCSKSDPSSRTTNQDITKSTSNQLTDRSITVNFNQSQFEIKSIQSLPESTNSYPDSNCHHSLSFHLAAQSTRASSKIIPKQPKLHRNYGLSQLLRCQNAASTFSTYICCQS